MTRYIVDISPMAVNRTAMYSIVRDTTRYLFENFADVRLQGMGEDVDGHEFAANGFAIPVVVKERISRRLFDLIESDVPFPDAPDRREADTICIVFDPLYLMFQPVNCRTIVFVLDLTPVTRPGWHNPRVSLLYSRALQRLWSPLISVVAISESTRRDLWANYGIPAERVDIVHLYNRLTGALTRHVRPPDSDGKTLLFVGSLEERKNIRGLIEGFRLSRLHAQGFSLVIVGGDGHGAEGIKQDAMRVRGVRICGWLSDDELTQEYVRASALVYPSYWEGFGLPVLEALAYGIPCVLGDSGALPGIAGDSAIYCDPCDVVDIARALLDVTGGEARRSAAVRQAKAQERLASFTKEHYLLQVRGVIDKAAGLNVDGIAGRPSSAEAKQARTPVPIETHSSRFGEILRRLRVLETRGTVVPSDSFSIDYLYVLQQEKRLALSSELSSFRLGTPWKWPAKAAMVALSYGSLLLTNAYVRAQINELILLKEVARQEGSNG